MQLAQEGRVQLVWHPAIVIDAKFPGSNNSFLSATHAWGCAIDAGRLSSITTSSSPIRIQLRAGVLLTSSFLNSLRKSDHRQCIQRVPAMHVGCKYDQWAQNSENGFNLLANSGVIAETPAGIPNGTPLRADNKILLSPSLLTAAVEKAGPASAQSAG